MKKIISLLLAAAMLLLLVACSSSKPAETTAPATEATAAPTTEATTVPTTEATTAPTTEPTTEPTTAPTTAPTKPPVNPPFITKNPTSESITEGDNAYFVAKAEDYDYIDWFIVSADHRYQYHTSEAPRYFRGLSIAGDHTTQLILCNCPTTLDGWCVEAVFTGEGGRSTTDHCYVHVKNAPRAQLWANPSSGYFEYSDQRIQLNANPGDKIYYEMYTENGNYTGTVNSGDFIYIPAIADIRYDAYLYAYVVGDKGNAISCQYTMDCLPHYDPDPVPEPDYYKGTYRNSNGDTIKIHSDGNGGSYGEVSIIGLSRFDFDGSQSGAVMYLSMQIPDFGWIRAVFDGSTLYISESDWELLPPGDVIYGFTHNSL